MESLIDIINNKQLRTDKEGRHRYCSTFYDSEFANFRDKNIKLLEVGISTGASLVLFNEYFQNSEIYGLDLKDYDSYAFCQPYSRIKTIYEDAYSKSVADSLPNFDIIIDDGPQIGRAHV